MADASCKTCNNMSRYGHHWRASLEDLGQSADLGCSSCQVLRRGSEGATGSELSELDPDSNFWIVGDPYGAHPFNIEVNLGPHTIHLEFYTVESMRDSLQPHCFRDSQGED